MEQYLEFWRQAAAIYRGNLAVATLLFDPRPLRDLWLAHLTETTDRYLRSPEFRDLLRISLRTVTGSTKAEPLPPR